MNRILLSGLLLSALATTSCGPRSRSAEPERNGTTTGPIGATLEVNVRDGVEFAFRVTNNEPTRVELLFPSAQTHDFVVMDSIGREVWRWSQDRMFTQIVVNKILDANASIAWNAAWRDAAPPGRYVAIASLLSENRPMEERVAFEVK